MIKCDIFNNQFDGTAELREVSHHNQGIQTVH